MLFYFSATGNSLHVANEIEKAIRDLKVSILEFDFNQEVVIGENDTLGIVTPIYCGGFPMPVVDFFKKAKLNIHPKAYVYFVATYGNFSGASTQLSNKYLKKNCKREFDARFGVKMPDTWTPVFDLSDGSAVARINEKADEIIRTVCKQIQNRQKGDFIIDKLPALMGYIYPSFYKKLSKTKNLKVEDSCVGCGLCEKNCPAKAIVMKDGKPTWTKENCIMCLGCLHRCPTFSIQYGDETKNHGQYQHPILKKSKIR